MAKKYKNTISIFLLITGLLMLSHSVLPHDHHYDNFVEVNHNEHQEKNNKGQEPIHCHFFNDIVVDNSNSTANQNLVKQIILLFSYIPELNIDFENTPVHKTIFYDDFHYPNFPSYIDVSPTRGSPLSF